MEPKVETKQGVTIVHLVGELRGEDGGAITSIVEPLLDAPSPRVVLALTQVNYVSSAGLGELVRLTGRANSQNARLALAQPSPFVAGVFKATRLDKWFEVHPTTEAAVAAVAT